MTAENKPFVQLVQTFFPHSKLLRTWSLDGGSSATMTALELAAADGQTRRLVVRRPSTKTLQRNPRAAENEFKLLQLTHQWELATPIPYHLDQSGTIFATPYLVIEYVEGQPEFAPPDTIDFAGQAAAHLARLHQIDGTRVDLAFLSQPAQSFAETFGKDPTSLDPRFAEEEMRSSLRAVWPLASCNPPALLHGDFWPGNLLWRARQLVAVIDWEDASMGDPLTDLAISRLDLLCLFGVEAMSAFTGRYQTLQSINYTQLPYWDLYAALRLVRMAAGDFAAWASFFPPFGRADITAQTLHDHYHFFVQQALASLRRG